jgi:hypothetical protein
MYTHIYPLLLHWEYAKHAFHLLSISYTRRRYKRIVRIFQINAPSLLLFYRFSKIYCNPGMGHEAMQNSYQKKEFYHLKKKERKKGGKKKERRNKEKKSHLIAHGPYLRKFLICLNKEKTCSRSKVELGLATKYFHTHAHLDLRV